MNTRPIIDESTGPVSLSAAFNSSASCFVVGLDSGFCVFHSDPCELKVSRDFNAGIGIAELLGSSNYLALVGGGRNPKWSQNKVIIWDDAKQKAAVTLELKTSVLQVRLTRKHVAVVLHNSVHLYAFSDPPKKLSVFETTDNPLGLSCLADKILAFPGRSPGKIQLVELATNNVSIIPAHTTNLRAMDLSPDGKLLASASETGTLLRVFSTANCARVAELRRGVDPAFIFNISISPSSSLLAVTSDKSTLHIFDLPVTSLQSPASYSPRQRSQSPTVSTSEDTNVNKWGFLSKIPLLPRVFSDIYSFASAHFEMGDEGTPHGGYIPALGSMPSRPQKGLIGWLDDATLLVVGTGKDGRWERFRIGERSGAGDEAGQRSLWRDGLKRYLGS
jgi:WD40 repeat protein